MGVKENMLYGIKSYFRHLASGKIIAPCQMSPEMIDTIFVKKTVNTINKSNRKSCDAVLELMKDDYPVPIRDFFKETGKRYAMTNNDAECKRFLIDYLNWLTQGIRTPEVIHLPSAPNFPSLDEGFGDVKQSLQVTGVVLMAFVALLIYIMFAKGGAGREVHVG